MTVETAAWAVVFVYGLWIICLAFLSLIVQSAEERGDWDKALHVAGWLERVYGTPVFMRVAFLGYAGRTSEAVALIDKINLKKTDSNAKTLIVNTLITAGQYQRALAIELSDGTTKSIVFAKALNEVNRAEAEYNLGRWQEALLRVDAIACPREKFPLVASGAAMQRAWILAHLGQVDRARASYAEAVFEDFPYIFRAEPHYTEGAIELAAGNLDAALTAVQQGLSAAMRVSSKRNGRFLRARIHMARGENKQALADFETAAAGAYQAQGGDGLLAWGDLLARLNRIAVRRSFPNV